MISQFKFVYTDSSMTDQTSSQTTSDEEVQDAEVVETPTHSTSSNLEERLSIEQMIKNYMSDISRIREKLKTQKDMFKSSFESDKEFSDVDTEHKAIARKKTVAKQRIIKTDAVSAVSMKIKEIQEEMKETQQALSDYLNRYIQVSDSTEFMGPDGEVHQIVRTAKLVKKK